MYQQTTIVGRLGKDPEMRYLQDGTPVTDFSVAVDGWNDKTTWFRVTCWRKLAEVTYNHLKKGRQVLVVGEIDASAYAGSDGQPRASLELTAREVKFLGEKGDSQGQQQQAPRQQDQVQYQQQGDLPF